MDMNKKNSAMFLIFAVILGICLIISATIASYTFYKVRTSADETLTVTGSVRQKVTSDMVKWTASFSRNIPVEELKQGYDLMKQDKEVVLKFFKEEGLDENIVTISPVFMEQLYLYDPNAPREYILRQNVEITSPDVQKITSIAKNTQKLIDEGVIFSTTSLEYYYTKLPELRISLLSEAVKDAKLRAEQIAKGSGREIRSIKSATSGVVQVLSVYSTEISDYGAYDTSTVEKEVMVTVSVVFTLK